MGSRAPQRIPSPEVWAPLKTRKQDNQTTKQCLEHALRAWRHGGGYIYIYAPPQGLGLETIRKWLVYNIY